MDIKRNKQEVSESLGSEQVNVVDVLAGERVGLSVQTGNGDRGVGSVPDKAGSSRFGEAGWVWERITEYALYILIFLTPLFFLPWGAEPIAQNKQFLAAVLIAIALIAWLSKTIASGKLIWARTPINIGAWALVAVWAASSFFSMSEYKSIGLVGVAPDSLLNLIKYVLAFFLIGATFFKDEERERGESVFNAVYVFLASLTFLAVFTGLKIFNINLLPHSASSGRAWDFAKAVDFNTIGTMNSLALLLGFGLVVVIGMIAGKAFEGGGAETDRKKVFVKYGTYILAAVLVIELVLINFRAAWWSMSGAMLFFAAYLFAKEAHGIRGGAQKVLRAQKLILPLIILGISVILLLVRMPVFFSFSQEVSPTGRATYNIAKEVLKSKGISTDLLGSGPATFTFDYGLYRGPLNNQNPVENLFWGVRFNQGSSFALTALATTGVLGVLALAFLIFAFLWQVFWRSGLLGGAETSIEALSVVFVSAVVYFFVSWFLYPANFSLLMFAFIALGLMLASRGVSSSLRVRQSADAAIPTEHRVIASSLASLTPRNDDSLREISLLASPQRTMIISLLLIILMIGSVSILYVESQKYVASLYYASGVNEFNQGKNPDLAFEKIGKAIRLDAVVDVYQRTASQLFLIKTKNALDGLQSASGIAAESLRAEFQNNMAQAVSFAKQAQNLDPNESANWSNLGYAYESVLLFVDGAEDWMIKAYQEASRLEPQNPALLVDLGRAHLAVSGKVDTQLNQALSAEKPDQAQIDIMKQKINDNIAKGIRVLNGAIELKPDYSQAHLLLAQAYTRQGDIKNAIAKSADYYNLNPSDAGAAFQLGYLLYADKQMDGARLVLERAVELNSDYSNARYFLGLIYDIQGQKNRAKEQFEKIARLNPDNAEVKKILDNLNVGRGALETVVPPAPPPDQRTQAPVPETGGASGQPLKP